MFWLFCMPLLWGWSASQRGRTIVGEISIISTLKGSLAVSVKASE